jgi:hypothetical protein
MYIYLIILLLYILCYVIVFRREGSDIYCPYQKIDSRWKDENLRKVNAIKDFKFYLLNYLVNVFIKFKIYHIQVVGSIGSVKSWLYYRAMLVHFSRQTPYRPMSSIYYYFIYLFIFSRSLRCYPSMVYMESGYNDHVLIPPKDIIH